MAELRRSLYTSDYREARARCLSATGWFRNTVEKLSMMRSPTRADLEHAAIGFFDALARQVDGREALELNNLEAEVDFNLASSRDRIRDLDGQLIASEFDGLVAAHAAELLEGTDTTLDELPAPQRKLALHLAARAERENLELLIHSLTTPGREYSYVDKLFSRDLPLHPVQRGADGPKIGTTHGIALDRAADIYLARKTARNLGHSQITELARALGWLQERLGADRPVTAISKAELAKFRDDIARLDVSLQGKKLTFEARLTSNPDRQIKSVTALRYWNSVQSFFGWLAADGHALDNPAAGLKLESKKGEKPRSPEPFSRDELIRLFQTPIYSGYLSRSRVGTPGSCTVREGHWWAGVLPLFTGLRAGELSQLLPSDFFFSGDIPLLKVREEDETGKKVKSAKSASSIRDVPIAPVLMELGLAQFVARRAKASPKVRVFEEFRLGLHRKSDGMTKFWSRYLRDHGLWKPGRATHVWRHTVVAALRAKEVPEEDISAFVGHSPQTVTGGYGGDFPLARKLKTAKSLDYGFDVVAAVGGPFDGKRHG